METPPPDPAPARRPGRTAGAPLGAAGGRRGPHLPPPPPRAMARARAPMEEGFMLGFPELVLNGQVANRDFLHLYGPSSLWVWPGCSTCPVPPWQSSGSSASCSSSGVAFGVCFALRLWGGRCATGSPPPAGSGRRGGRLPGAGRQVIGPAVHVVTDDLRRVVEALAAGNARSPRTTGGKHRSCAPSAYAGEASGRSRSTSLRGTGEAAVPRRISCPGHGVHRRKGV